MGRTFRILWGVIAIVGLIAAMPAHADHVRGRVGIGVTIGAPWGWYPPPYYYYPPRYYYYDYPPPVVVAPEPPTYIEREPSQPSSSSGPQASEPAGFWYYCRNPEGYYPYVKSCAGGWERVSPRPPSGTQ